MNIFSLFNNLILSLQLGRFYLFYFSLALSVLNACFLLILVIAKNLRSINKSLLGFLELGLVFLALAKATCDGLNGRYIDLNSLPLSLFILFLSNVEYCVILVLKERQSELSLADKRLIDELLNQNEDLGDSVLQSALSQNPFRRIEYLATQKGLEKNERSDFNLNPSCIKSYIENLLKKPLNEADKIEVLEINKALEKYRLKNLSNFERDDFSTKLQRLLKLTAKYDTANFDLI